MRGPKGRSNGWGRDPFASARDRLSQPFDFAPTSFFNFMGQAGQAAPTCGELVEPLGPLPLVAVRGVPRDDRSDKMLLKPFIYKFGKDPLLLFHKFEHVRVNPRPNAVGGPISLACRPEFWDWP